jgi:hypothetical protein
LLECASTDLLSLNYLPSISKVYDLTLDFLENPTSEFFLQFENSLQKQFLQIADFISENALVQLLTDPDIIEQSIEKFRAKDFYIHSKKRKTVIQLLGGTMVQVKTIYMVPKQYKKRKKKRGKQKHTSLLKGVYPVLRHLGIQHRTSPALQNEITLSALNAPFTEARETLQRHGVEISEKRVRSISENVGEKALENRENELQKYDQGELEKETTFSGERLVITIDGGRTRIRKQKKGKKKKNQKRKGYYTDWNEPKIFKLYAINEKGEKLDKKILPFSDGTLIGLEKFKHLLKMYLYKTNAIDASQLIFIADGAPWIWNAIDEIIKEMDIDSSKIYKVLDFYHAAEHLWAVIDSLSNMNQHQKKRLFKKYRKQLKQGKIDSLIEILGVKERKNQKVHKELRYFHGNEEKCRYKFFVDQNIPIGSGAIESAVRRIINLRLKGAGMFWLKHNAEAFLHLRCQLKSNRWNQFFIKHINS